MALRKALRELFKREGPTTLGLKAISFVGWGDPNPIGPLMGGFSSGTMSSDRARYASEIGDPLRTPLIMAAVKWLGRVLPEAPLFIITRNDEGRVIARSKKHKVLSILKRPNDFYGGKNLMKALACSWILSGNAYWLKARNSDLEVIELWYEPHFTIRPRFWDDGWVSENVVAKSTKFIQFYEVYRYGKWIRVENEDVIHFKDGCDPSNTRIGINGLASLLAEIFTDLQRAHFSATVLANIGMIPFVVSPRESNNTITEPQAEKLKSELENRSRGERGKPIVAGRAIRIDELGFSPEDMDLTAMASIPEERVAAVIGPNSYVLGFTPENSIFSNFVEARRDAYESFLIPLSDYIAEELTRQLYEEFVDDENQGLEFDYSKVPAMSEHRKGVFDMWGRAYRDGITTRYTALISTGQEAEESDKVFLQDAEAEITEKAAQADAKRAEKTALATAKVTAAAKPKLPSRDIIDPDGNDRPRPGQDRGPVLGGKNQGPKKPRK